ncbi:MAG: hypothetical protein NXI10_08190 [bacterium]|nr:hypothetical protein [bacterium]
MKLTNRLSALAIALLLGCFINNALASEQDDINPTIEKETSKQEWTLVKEANETKVWLSISTIDNERFLSIKIENTTAENRNFLCSLNKNNESVIITIDEMREAYLELDPHSTHVIDGTYLIYIAEGDQIEDFTVTLNPTK